MKGEKKSDKQCVGDTRSSHREPARRHQTSINAIMGPGPDLEESNERSPLLAGRDNSSTNRHMELGMAENKQPAPVTQVRESKGRLGYFPQVGLLLWKNLLLQRRSIKVTLAEVFIPLFGALIMLAVRQIVESTDMKSNTTYPSQSLGTAGGHFLGRFHGNFMLYAPNSTLVNGIMGRVNTTLARELNRKVTVKGFKSEDDLVDFYESLGKLSIICPISVIFDLDSKTTTLPPDVRYTIRPYEMDDDKWNTRRVVSLSQVLSPRPGQDNYYYNRSFVYTQRVVGEALIQEWQPGAGDMNVSAWNLNRIPYPPYINDAMVQVLQQNFPNLLMLSFILSVIIMSKNIVYEKERQLKESMKLMGMSASAHWMSWFLQFFLYLVLACGVYTLFMSVSLGGKPAVLVYSDPSIVFVFLVIYSFSIVSYTFMISTFVSKANIAAALAGILFFAIFFPYYFLEQRYEDMNLSEKLGICVLFNMAMAYGIKTVGLYEGTGQGAQWDGFTKPASVDDNFSLMHAMVMLVVDACILLVITWYLDNVRPGTYGVPRPLYFPFQLSYWRSRQRDRSHSVHKVFGGSSSHHFEADPSGLPIGISMVHLRKVFDQNKVAVKDSTLNIYEGQITVLLGHNGAGKTTTMSMLTGFIPPSSGTAYVNGYDIRTDINSVRSNLGLCPQHNILFESLTVDEHLNFFARLKGVPKKEIPEAVAGMAKEVGLEAKRSARAGTLSGGQKRKLSVGIALIGGSKIVILDEPTSGMDPAARRQTWDILQRHRQGRTMLLSTHFMDEADLLGDRIAIMAEGVVKCCGTSLFLKKLYGAGYHMVLVKGPQCDVAKVTALVQRQITGAQLESEIGAELSYLLPEEQGSKFAQLFRVIEQQYQELGITSFGASATTMEEVFLKVGASGVVDDSTVSSERDVPTDGESVVDGRTVSSERDVPTDGESDGVLPEPFDVEGSYSNPSFITEASGPSQGMERTADPVSPGVDRTADPVSQGVDNSEDSSSHGADNPEDSVGKGELITNGTAAPDTIIDASSVTAQMALDNSFQRLQGFSLDWSRFWGMFVKKAIHTLRNRIISGVQLALPVIFTIAALTVDKVRPGATGDPPRYLNLSMFDGTTSAYTAGISPNSQSRALATSYASQFHGDNSIQSIDRGRFPDMNNFYLTKAKDGLYTYNKKVLIGAEFEPQGGKINATAWYSGQPFHAMPVALAYAMNAFARQVTGQEHSIMTINYPMPKNSEAAAEDAFVQAMALGFSIGFSMLFGMAFLSSSLSYFLIRERQAGAKHLQVVSGVGPLAFWLSSFAWDLVNYLIPCVVLLVVFAAFQVDAYTDDGNLGLVLLYLFLFGIAVIPFVYILQFPFTIPATGFVVLVILSIISGLFTMLIVFILRLPTLGTEDVAKVLDWVFMAIFPHYNLGTGFCNIYINRLDMDTCAPVVDQCHKRFVNTSNPCCKDACGDFCLPFTENYLAWDYPGVGRNVLFLCLQCGFYFLLTLALDYQLPQKLVYLCRGNQQATVTPTYRQQGADISVTPSADQDRDVALEQQRVDSGRADEDTLVLRRLCKRYGGFMAVDHISVGVPEQECFGLLGQNGAGKTTTFKMLTGDVMVTEGDAFVRGHSIKLDIKQVQSNLGYCPQFDALIDQMTGRETLVMYARMRGVPSSYIKRIVDNLISLLMLEPHADKMTMQYSGGNKRKLSTAVALVGGPAVILLDEPSSGMDPAARRQLWNVLSQVRASGRTLILTSHSMEECDALCTRIAIMVNGQFRCLGSPQHLKSTYGHGYTLVVKMATGRDGQLFPIDPLVSAIVERFPGTQKFDDHQGYVHFQVPDSSVPLSEVFEVMEGSKSQYGVEDYSVHQTTLEQIFLTFTRAQFPPRPERPASCFATICPCLS